MWHFEKITSKIPNQSPKMHFVQSDRFVKYNLTVYIHKVQKKQLLHVRAQKRKLPLSVIWCYSRKRHWSSSERRRQASYFKLRICITSSARNVHPCESHLGLAEDFRNKGEPREVGLCQLWNRSVGSPLAVGVRGSPGSEGELLWEAAAHPAQGPPVWRAETIRTVSLPLAPVNLNRHPETDGERLILSWEKMTLDVDFKNDSVLVMCYTHKSLWRSLLLYETWGSRLCM